MRWVIRVVQWWFSPLLAVAFTTIAANAIDRAAWGTAFIFGCCGFVVLFSMIVNEAVESIVAALEAKAEDEAP